MIREAISILISPAFISIFFLCFLYFPPLDGTHNQGCCTLEEAPLEAAQGEVIFLPLSFINSGSTTAHHIVHIDPPEGWLLVPLESDAFEVEPHGSHLHICGIKISETALAGTYCFLIHLKGDEEQDISITITVKPKLAFTVEAKDLPEQYLIGEAIDFTLTCINEGNIPLTVYMQAETDPPRCRIFYPTLPQEIAAQSRCEIPIHIEPEYRSVDYQQFVFVRLFNQETAEQLYSYPYCLNLKHVDPWDDDCYQRIPSELSFIAVGDRCNQVYAIQCSGEGFVDPERKRYFEYDVLLPTDNQQIFYNIQESFYFDLSEPSWDIEIGDTDYALSPLTQRYRYGRGGGFEITQDSWSAGAHYTQNVYNSRLFPKELCAYFESAPSDLWSLSSNYMHRSNKGFPNSNIATLEMELKPKENIFFDCEVGKSFQHHNRHHSSAAYRADLRGKFLSDTWFEVEKIYAGPAFNGYYQNVNLFSSICEIPIWRQIRLNLSYNRLKQDTLKSWDNDKLVFAPRQRQFNGNLSYQFANGYSLTLNGMLLRAREVSKKNHYDFNQKWLGFTLNFAKESYYFNGWCSFGQQKDYLTGKDNRFLQKYYACIGKELNPRLSATFFYEAGNINYYEARQWHTGVGGTCRYRYHPGGWLGLTAQHTRNTSPNRFNVTEGTFNLTHQFRNRSTVDARLQYFYYYGQYHNNLMFLFSYTTPFGLPVGHKKDKGELTGTIYDSWNRCPITEALVQVNNNAIVTNPRGQFSFPALPAGDLPFKLPILPDHLITEEPLPPSVKIRGGKKAEMRVNVVPSCSIKGQINRYIYDESSLETKDLVQTGGEEGMRIAVSRAKGKEIYTSLSDIEGQFYFPKLRPGRWIVSLKADYLPGHTYVDKYEIELDVGPGEKQEVAFNIYPAKREVYSFD